MASALSAEARLKHDLGRLLGHWAVNVLLALIWGTFALNAYHRWSETGSLILFGLVAFNTILVVVTIARRRSTSTSTHVRDWVAALLTVGVSMMLQPGQWAHPVTQVIGALFQGLGLAIMAIALVNLGRSFGVVAANRGIKCSGLYGWIRHPLYAGEIIFFSGFLVANVSVRNLVIWIGLTCGLVLRSWFEEDLLSQDPEYQAYMTRVRYSFVPGLF